MASPFSDLVAPRTTGGVGTALAVLPEALPLIYLTKDSPFRPVNWRWQKADQLHRAGRRPSRSHDDSDTVSAYYFQSWFNACADRWDRFDLEMEYPDITGAYRIETGAGDAECTRWEVQARLLASDETLESIASKCCIRVGAVRWYENLFFNVRDRLHNTGYLLNYALGRQVHTGMNESDVCLIWKLFAMAGGVIALEDLMRLMTPTLLYDQASLPKFHQAQAKEIVARKATIAALTYRARDAMSKSEIMQLQQKYVEADQAAQGAAGTDERSLDGLQMVLNSIKIYVAEPAPGKLPNGVFPNGAEMRAHDLLLQKMGHPVILPPGFGERPFPEAKRLVDREDAADDDTSDREILKE